MLVGLGGWTVVLAEDLIIRLEGAHEVKQPSLVGYTELINAAVIEKIAAFADAVELPEQQLDGRWSWTRQQFDILVMRTEGLAAEDVAHVLLRDHRGLVLGHVVAVHHHGVVEVTLVGMYLEKSSAVTLIVAGLLDMGIKINRCNDYDQL